MAVAVAPRTGSGLPGGRGDPATDAVGGAATAAEECGEAPGEADAPGCVLGSTGGGLIAPAGCPRASDCEPLTEVGFGVPLAFGEGLGADFATASPPGAADASGLAIGPADIGFLFAKSATVNCIARSIGNRTVPLFLSIQV